MDKYVAFYMQGRADIADDDTSSEVDITAIAMRVLAGEDMYKVTQEVADAALRPRGNSTSKTRWLRDNVDEIKDAGGDKEKAYTSFLAGQIAELRYILEDETCDAMEEQLVDAEEPEPDDDGDEEEEDILEDDEK